MRKALSIAALTVLSGCLGGGGGGGGAPPTANPNAGGFPGFSNAAPNSVYQVSGVTRAGVLTRDPASGAFAVSSRSSDVGVTAEFGFDGRGELNAVRIDSSATPFDVDADAGGLITDEGRTELFRANGGDVQGRFGREVLTEGGVTAQAETLEHMTYGQWFTGLGGNTTRFGVGAFGSPTNAAALRGVANYDGETRGFYVSPTGERFLTGGRITADVDFDSGDVDMVTRDTVRVNETGVSVTDPRLDAFFTGAVRGGALSGTVVSTSGVMTGSFEGQTFGPRAEEIGGSYSMRGADGEVVSAFGARAR